MMKALVLLSFLVGGSPTRSYAQTPHIVIAHAPSPTLGAPRPPAPVGDELAVFGGVQSYPFPGGLALTVEDDEVRAERALAWLKQLGTGLVSLFLFAVGIALSLRVSGARRQLYQFSFGHRAVPLPLFLSLLSPLVPPLLLLHAEPGLLPSPILFLSLAGAGLAALLLDERRRLAAELRWAAVPIGMPPDGTVVMTELTPRRLVGAEGLRARAPWFLCDLVAHIDGRPVRVGLARATVDAEACAILQRLAAGTPIPGARLTVAGTVSRVPADADGADPLCRDAATQLRFATPLIAGQAPYSLLARLRSEGVSLVVALTLCLAAALLAL
jgi:hypothetical protein